MRRYTLLLTAASMVAFSQYAVAGRCEVDTESPVYVDTAVLNFDSDNTMRTMTVTNTSGAVMNMYVFIPGEWGGYGWGGYPGYGWGGYPGYGSGDNPGAGQGQGYGRGYGWGGYPGYGSGDNPGAGQGQGYGRGYGRGYGYGSGGFEGVGCDGQELLSGEDCVITVSFLPGQSSEKRQYHKKMTIGGVTPEGEFSQTVCLDAAN